MGRCQTFINKQKVRSKSSHMSCWGALRNGVPLRFDNSPQDVFNVLASCKAVFIWIWASREPGFQRHPTTGETVLHLLCRTNALDTNQKMGVFGELKKDFRNPLIPDFQNQRAIDLTYDPILKAALSSYMEFRPKRQVMHWFGPCFLDRVVTLLLVLKRLKVRANKDVRTLLAKYLSKVEYIFVKSKVSPTFFASVLVEENK
jgi:hypothetical protein